MPPQKDNQNSRTAKKAVIAAPGSFNPHTMNDGSIIADGVRVRGKAWHHCKNEECERPIYFIRVGENCVYHPVPVANQDHLSDGREYPNSYDPQGQELQAPSTQTTHAL